MAQEEHILNYSGVSSNSRSKKVKQKKVPQRGLGVAQLERIRLEEQQKKEALQAANLLANNAIGTNSSPSDHTNPCRDFRTSFSPPNPNLAPLPPPPPSPSTNFLFRPPSSEISHQSSVHMSNGRGETRLHVIPGRGNWPRLNLDGEKQRFDHHGSAFRGQVNLPYDSNVPVLSPPSVPQRLHQFQQHSSSSSTMNSSSGISPLSSQMEPPSSQSYRGNNNYMHSRSEEDKMLGIKRPYPFSLESPPAPSFHRDFPTFVASRSRSDELVSCSIGDKPHMEARKKHIREGPSNSSTPSEPEHDPKEVIRDDEKPNGDFLTLAPPLAASQPLNSMYKHPSNYSEHQDPSQESQVRRLEPSGSAELTYSFFPVKMQNDQTSTYLANGNSNGEKNEAIDLNLKL